MSAPEIPGLPLSTSGTADENPQVGERNCLIRSEAEAPRIRPGPHGLTRFNLENPTYARKKTKPSREAVAGQEVSLANSANAKPRSGS